ncbi:UDP-N-acetylglucosamine 1-carboxyvinyltransferase [Fodinicurvata halophila]|uniref:UDP-N-acetylglucosamine 1-carboxyvinyltransferase n=1 Tax=Fodinicurvata halophila TaxID=1419723 RepID=A0ABV8UID9_9PROT
MDKIKITGGVPLNGTIRISGSKNAALPLMAASLLTRKTLCLENVPQLADIRTMSELLGLLGVSVEERGNGPSGRSLVFRADEIASTVAPYDLVRKMRASVLVLGPLLARQGHAEVSLPGGCAIGTRPVDLHLGGLEAMGAQIELADGYIQAQAPNGLKGAEIIFSNVSVGATENLMMAAALAEGETRLVNAAREPEIVDLANCLTAMGADIEGAGKDEITIRGRASLAGATHHVIPDRIETGTFVMAAAISDGDLCLEGARADHLEKPFQVLRQAGVAIDPVETGLRVRRANGPLQGADIMTEAFPGFATDLQAQFMALMATAEGASMITETIFENRFMHVPELMRMGADITVHGASALVRGRQRLKAAPVMATDLRASVSLVLAALAAEGETELNRVYHLDRGYERIEEKLAACGASIVRSKESTPS